MKKPVYSFLIVVMTSSLLACSHNTEDKSSNQETDSQTNVIESIDDNDNDIETPNQLIDESEQNTDIEIINDTDKWDIDNKERHLSEEHLLEWEEQFINSDAFMNEYANSYFFVDGVRIHIPTTPRQIIKLFELDESATNIECVRDAGQAEYSLSVKDNGNGSFQIIRFALNEDYANLSFEEYGQLKYEDLADMPVWRIFLTDFGVLHYYDIAFPFYTNGYSSSGVAIDLKLTDWKNPDPAYIVMTNDTEVWSNPIESDMFSNPVTDIPIGTLLEFVKFHEKSDLDGQPWIEVKYGDSQAYVKVTESLIVKYWTLDNN